MLAFKNNIYDTSSLGKLTPSPDPNYNSSFDPRHFVEVALNQEEEVLSFIERQPQEYWREDFSQFYPHAGRINSMYALKEILRILQFGLDDTSCWQHMNTYHFCFLYDVFVRFSFNYNHDNLQEKLLNLPELEGKPVFLGIFISNYFFNKAFLVDPEHFNSLEREDKITLGYDGPHLFAVVNGLTPTREEMSLKESQDYPYTVFV
ncbi:MAG: hypothetical protein H8E42_01700 [Nitrospinae bacterium]|nr:hypothetical protein [Nitrospinota bacterium]MBL7019405.1 hypothetical protein [Nitrospinaceae bacterium]